MTKIEITIKDGKVTWVDQSGDGLDYEKWTELNLALARIFDKKGN